VRRRELFPLISGVSVLLSLCILGSPLALYGLYLLDSNAQPPLRVPSNVAWSEKTIATASGGNAVRGLVIATRCARCHGQEGFSAKPEIPNLAGLDKLVIWKQLNDFRDHKRTSVIMNAVAGDLEAKDFADLAAFYSLLPVYPDPGDTRAFPGVLPASSPSLAAARLVTLGDGTRGVPPCQSCHGPSGHKIGAPSLITQNSTYIRDQLQKFAEGDRSNDINMPMRSIAGVLTDQEKQALADYYGSGLGSLPASTSGPSRAGIGQ
jgi:cytochrome c553